MKKYFFLVSIIALLIGCSKDEAKPAMRVTNNNLILFHEGTEELVVENTPGDLTFESKNSLIASVTDEGVVEGRVRGETTILVTSFDEKINKFMLND